MLIVSQNVLEFTSSNATNIIAEYDVATTYIGGDEVRVDTRIYKSIADANLGNYPPDTVDTFWMDWEASNEYAMLDLFEDTVTNFSGSGVVEFSANDKEVIAIGNFNATTITLEYLDALDVVLDTEIYLFPFLGNRIDPYSYIYADFESSQYEVVYKGLKRIGTKIRVTFDNGLLDTYCGYLVAGKATDMGCTIDSVNFVNKAIGYENKRVATFKTTAPSTSLMKNLEIGEQLLEVPRLFIIDPSTDSNHQNMTIIAKITKCDGIGSNMSENQISWELTQN